MQRGCSHELADEMGMGVEESKQPSTTRQVGKQLSIVPGQPTPEITLPLARQTVEQRQCHHFTGIQISPDYVSDTMQSHHLLGRTAP